MRAHTVNNSHFEKATTTSQGTFSMIPRNFLVPVSGTRLSRETLISDWAIKIPLLSVSSSIYQSNSNLTIRQYSKIPRKTHKYPKKFTTCASFTIVEYRNEQLTHKLYAFGVNCSNPSETLPYCTRNILLSAFPVLKYHIPCTIRQFATLPTKDRMPTFHKTPKKHRIHAKRGSSEEAASPGEKRILGNYSWHRVTRFTGKSARAYQAAYKPPIAEPVSA